MTNELPKAFEPKLVEDKWAQFWDNHRYYVADSASPKPSYSIVMPPPNVTGVLHMGHALVNTLQDVLVRWKRMLGYEVLWVPGTDHAGIATQTIVERNLIATTGKRRKDFTREEFLSHVWAWKEQSQHTILEQLKKLGCSCDWSRLAFTMDAPRNTAVKTMFKKLFDEGLIYRGDYLVNWDPVTQTALADDEVEYEEKASFLWHLRYPIEGENRWIVIATTRPETMLGDTAVAVAPGDPRYQSLIGKNILLPLSHRKIPIIEDRHVDPSFGTGAVKVTPAHDPNDYEMGLSHGLPFLNIMTPDGKINEKGREFASMTMQEARSAVIAKMESLGLVEKIEPHTHRVGISYRSKAVIEPYLSKQWFVKMSALQPILRQAVEEKKVKLIPESWENTYFHWIDNLRDWCISRQLWWGHRIPIWYDANDPTRMICYAGEDLPPEVAQNPGSWRQDEDVLDTWFSSALWPFSVLGWPNATQDLSKFYPTSTLITGHDILFFWVARMILMGTYALDKPPFPETYLHGLIYGKSYWICQKEGSVKYITGKERDAYDLGEPLPAGVQSKWEKMSKSKGNIIDPLEIIDSYGTDAMRMALCASATQARQIDLDRRKFEEFKNFANKVWNGARFVFMHLETLASSSFAQGLDIALLNLEDRWILSLMNRTIDSVNHSLAEYHFDKAALTAYDFFWKDFCAYYVELAKPYLFGKAGIASHKENKQKILAIVLGTTIRLLHPMAPFITEELFAKLKNQFDSAPVAGSADVYTKATLSALKAPCCMVSSYPTVFCKEDMQESIEETFSYLSEVVTAIRNIRAEMQLPPSLATDLWIIGNLDSPALKKIEENQVVLQALVRLNTLHLVSKEPALEFSANAALGDLCIMIPLPEELREKEKTRLMKEKEKLSLQLEALDKKLSQPEFISRAPQEVVNKLRNQKQTILEELQLIEKKLQ